MSARKLGRLAGLVFMLAALVGGVAAISVGHAATDASAAMYSTLDYIWT
jgi:hypothetical protein